MRNEFSEKNGFNNICSMILNIGLKLILTFVADDGTHGFLSILKENNSEDINQAIVETI